MPASCSCCNDVPSPVPEDRSSSRLVAAALAAALMPLNSTMIAVALPDISAELDADPAVVTQALVTSYLVAAIVLRSRPRM